MSSDAEVGNDGLTEDQRAELAELRKQHASAQALAAQHRAAIDELERISDEAVVAPMMNTVRRRRSKTEEQEISLVAEEPRHWILPEPARFMVIQSRIISSDDLSNPPLKPPLPDSAELRERYETVRSINSFAFGLGLQRADAIKALKNAGIDIYEEIARAWQKGTSVRELSRCHGVGRDTISRWIRRTGRAVPIANSRKRYDEQVVVNVYQETRSCNRAAKAAHVAWRTAKMVLVRHGLWADE
ncbi:helix-hairpin-helix domain-containing protein [Paracoccus salipaludis]|nr:helix-hairpin-helix domain-containing protein [Paracoccus salipaludis]